MPLYTFKDKQITEVQNTQFGIEEIQERSDLQAALRDKIDKITVISPDTLVINPILEIARRQGYPVEEL